MDVKKLEKSILLVDDHLIVRKGVELVLLAAMPKVTIYNAENYKEAIEIVNTIKLDLIILDININGVENIKIMNEIKSIYENVKILIFSSYDEKHYGLRYIQKGADGYLNKFCDEDKMISAVIGILDKGFFYSDEIKEKLTTKSRKKYFSNAIDSLSNRELEVAQLLINGYGNLEISNKLDIQMSTVSTYKNRVFEKLNVNNVVALSDMFKDAIN
jgi:DNA-binding NarL/FixJ family response regulator